MQRRDEVRDLYVFNQWANARMREAVAALDEDSAQEALQLIQVEYEVLPSFLSAEEALDPGERETIHPPGKPEQLRTAHLADLKTPALIVQGTRDGFGTRDEVAGYDLAPGIELSWLEDGDHDLKPRKSVSGFSAADHLRTMAETVRAWMDRVAG